MYDLIIMGGGPAGVGAGIYASRKRIKTLLLTDTFGGQSINSALIENFVGFEKISGFDFAQTLEKHLRTQDHIDVVTGALAQAIQKTPQGFVVTDQAGKTYETHTVLVTVGSSYRKLDVPGEAQFEGKGVFYCSICDAPLMKGKEAAVIGGGNSGLEAVIDLLPYATKIYVLNRSDVLKGDPVYQERIAKESKVQILMHTAPESFAGSQFLESIAWKNTQTGETGFLPVSGAFVEIGYIPNTSLVQDVVTLNERKQIVVDHKTQQTSCPGIWAAGDGTDALYHQINTAMGDGVKAVLNIYEYLNKVQ